MNAAAHAHFAGISETRAVTADDVAAREAGNLLLGVKPCALGWTSEERMRARFAADFALGRVVAASCHRCGYGVGVTLDYSCAKCGGGVSAHMVEASNA